jgi:hypothetical protein
MVEVVTIKVSGHRAGLEESVGSRIMAVQPSISDIEEGSLVEQLLADPSLRSNLLAIQGIPPDPLYFQKVDLDGAPGGVLTDVDILLCAPGQPESAVAIEAKRVKVGANALRRRRPNKLRELKKGVQQANLLAQIGFSQVYFFVLVVVDSREKNMRKISYDGADSELRSLIEQAIIEQAISVGGLNARVGLVHYELVQPMDYPPLGMGALDAYGAHLIRSAQTVPQPAGLSRWVAEVAEHRTKMASK